MIPEYERKLKWLAFPGLFKYAVFLVIVTFVCQWQRPDLADLMVFDTGAIQHGQVWRIFTFLLVPPPLSAYSALCMALAVSLAVSVSDSLDNLWGPVRTTLYLLTGWLAMAISSYHFDYVRYGAGNVLYLSVFLAFAVNFPQAEITLMGFLSLPSKIWGLIAAGLLAYRCYHYPVELRIVLPALVPFAIWALPDLVRGRVMMAKTVQRRGNFKAASVPKGESFHHCDVCERTEKSDPSLHFYTLADGREYCEEHLPEEHAGK